MKTRKRTEARDGVGTIVAEIVFSGLCLVRVGECGPEGGRRSGRSKGEPRRPRRASKIEVLLVDTFGKQGKGTGRSHDTEEHQNAQHLHYPLLNYYAEDDLGLHARASDRWDGVLHPSPAGKEVVSVDLRFKRVEIIPPWPFTSPKSSKLSWCDAPSPYPKNPQEDDRLDWVLQSGQTGLESVDPDRAIAVITGLPGPDGKRGLPNGEWRTRTVHRNREVKSRRPIRWKVGSLPESRAIARDVVLSLTSRGGRGGGDRRSGLTLRISDRKGDPDPHDIVLMPGGDDRLSLSISNLPRVLSEPWESHRKMFSSLGPGEIVDVVQDDDLVCATGTPCDDHIHFE